jgi:hypothetical protein
VRRKKRPKKFLENNKWSMTLKDHYEKKNISMGPWTWFL